MLVSTIDHSPYLGRLAIGRVERGTVRVGDPILLLAHRNDDVIGFAPHEGDRQGKVPKLFVFEGLQRQEVPSRERGRDRCAGRARGRRDRRHHHRSGAPGAAGRHRRRGADHLRRLHRQHVALLRPGREVRDEPAAARPAVQGAGAQRRAARRGHRLARHVHGERPRRAAPRHPHGDHAPRRLRVRRLAPAHHHEEGPDGAVLEPYEEVVIDVPEAFVGVVIEKLGGRRGEMLEMRSSRARAPASPASSTACPPAACSATAASSSPTRAARACCTTASAGTVPGPAAIRSRDRGVMVCMADGVSVAYSLWNLQERGALFIGPGVPVYEGMIVGENARPGDLEVNVTKGKKLTNIRAAGADDAILLETPAPAHAGEAPSSSSATTSSSRSRPPRSACASASSSCTSGRRPRASAESRTAPTAGGGRAAHRPTAPGPLAPASPQHP
jgi:GTP-binding protein